MTDLHEDDLDRLFAASRQDRPGADLTARVLALAAAEQPRAAGPGAAPATAAPRLFWRDLLALIGGWRGAGGLSTAMIVGFGLGLAGPLGLLPADTATESYELMPGVEGLDLLSMAEVQE